MSMDLFGLNPKNDKGKHFKNGHWAWFPLWDYVQAVAPSVASKVQFPHENFGDGMCQEDAEELAEVLRERVDSGHTSTYENAFEEWKNSGVSVNCVFCRGRGFLKAGQRLITSNEQDGRTTHVLGAETPCLACHGTARTPELARQLLFGVENVEAFIEFLEACGGFVIM
jgi:hypothetical protein